MGAAVGKIRVAGAEQRAHSSWLRKYSEQLRRVRKSQSVEDYVTVFNQAIPTIGTILLFWAGVDLLTGSAERAGGQTIGVGTFFFSSRRRHTIFDCDWSSDVCSSD